MDVDEGGDDEQQHVVRPKKAVKRKGKAPAIELSSDEEEQGDEDDDEEKEVKVDPVSSPPKLGKYSRKLKISSCVARSSSGVMSTCISCLRDRRDEAGVWRGR